MQESNQIQPKKKHWYKTWWGILLIIFIVIPMFSGMILGAILSNNRDNYSNYSSQSQEQIDQAKARQEILQENQARQTAIDTYAPIYCTNQQKIIVNEPKLLAEGWPNADGSHGVTNEECATIITKLYDYLSDYINISSRLKSISERKVFIGMKKIELIYSWGEPSDINKTTTAYGVSEQWVYGNPIYGANYVYLDDDIVTSIQN